MAQTIKLKRSSVAGNIPSTSDLALGEVAINTADGKMYIKKSVDGTDSIIDLSDSPQDAILQEYQFTTSANQTTFSGADDNNDTLYYTAGAVQIFLNGILLDSGVDYTATTNTSIVLAEAVDANDYLQVFAFKQKISGGSVTVNTFTGNGSTTAFTLSVNPGDENNTRVFIDGVYQSKSNYSVSATTLTFTTAPPTGTAIEVESGNRDVALDTTTNLDFPDNVKLRLGTSQDLQLYHDGSNSHIKNTGSLYVASETSGDLYLRSDDDIFIQPQGGENGITLTGDGAVTLYHNNAVKLATDAQGINVTGGIDVADITATGNVSLNSDGGTAYFGAGADLRIFHDGNNSFINNTTGAAGALSLKSHDINIMDAQSHNMAVFTQDGAVTLYHDNSPKLATTSSGINVTGTVTADGLVVDGGGSRQYINAGHLRLSDDYKLEWGGGTNYISGNNSTGNISVVATGDINLDADSGSINFKDGGVSFGTLFKSSSNMILYSSISNGDIKFMGVDGGNNITALTLDMSNAGAATFNSSITGTGPIQALAGNALRAFSSDNSQFISITKAEIATPGNLTLDVAGDIILDADGGDILLKDGGTHWASVYTNGTNTYIQNMVNSGDVYLSGKDGSGNGVNALILDMSDGGAAHFTNDIYIKDNQAIRFGDDQDFRIFNDNNHTTFQNSVSNQDMLFKGIDDGSLITALTLDMSNAGAATFSGSVTSTELTVQPDTGATTALLTLNNGNGNGTLSQINLGYTGDPDHGNIKYTGAMAFQTGGNQTALTLDSSQNATFSGSVSTGSGGASGKIAISGSTASNEFSHITFTNGQGAKTYAVGGGQSGVTNNGFVIRNVTDNTFPLVISDAGASTFSGSVTSTVNNTATPAQIATDSNAVLLLENTNASGSAGIRLRGGNGAGVLMYGENNSTDKFYLTPRNDTGKSFTLDHVGNGVFQGSVTTSTVRTGSGALTLDSADEVRLDSNPGYIRLRKAGGDIGMFDVTSTDLIMRAMIADTTMRFRGTDSTNVIDGLTLDFDNAGAATFNSSVTAPLLTTNDIKATGSGGISIQTDEGTKRLEISDAGITTFTKSGGGNIRIAETASRYVEIMGYAEGTANGSTMAFHTVQAGTSTSTERMRIDSSGNVGILQNSPSSYYAKNLVVGAGTTEEGITIRGASNGRSYLMFADGTTGNQRYRGYIGYNHDTEALELATGASVRFTIDSSGDITGTGDTKFLATGDIGIGPRQGTASSGGVYIGGSTDNPFVSPTAYFSTGGNVGIGMTNPGRALDVAGTFGAKVGSSAMLFNEYSNGAVLWLDGSNGDFSGGDYFGIHALGTTDLSFSYASGVHMTMKNDGKFGIGTSAPMSHLHVNKDTSGHNTDGITLGKVEANGWIDTNEEMGRLGWAASYGSSHTPAIGAYISAKADANWNGNEAPTRLGFFTAPENSLTPVERLRISKDGTITPGANGTQDFGSNSMRWANMYTGDLHLSNEEKGGNDIDGTTGNWTVQEGEENLYLINNKTGKKYKFALEEIE